MKLAKFALGIFLLVSATLNAQEENRECDRMLFLAQQARMERNDFKESTMYMHKAEQICGGLEQKNMVILIISIRNTIAGITDPAQKMAYQDSLESAYVRAEAGGMYDQADDAVRATNILGTSKPDRKKADELYKRAIATLGEKIHESYLSYYYYNLYAIYAESTGDEQKERKKEMITVYFELSTLIGKANMTAQTQQTITEYFNAVVRTCDDILPDLKGFMTNLPQDPAVKKLTVNNFLTLLEKKECTDSPEYYQLIDTLVALDPTSVETVIRQADGLIGRGKSSEGIAAYQKAKGLTDDAELKAELAYKITNAYYRSGSYTTAYNSAMSVQGKYRGQALIIAGNCVAKNANNCGSSTFERKCNYIYAVQLLEQAKALGENVSGISNYRANFPTSEECFDNGSPSSVSLSCYGVSVSPCN